MYLLFYKYSEMTFSIEKAQFTANTILTFYKRASQLLVEENIFLQKVGINPMSRTKKISILTMSNYLNISLNNSKSMKIGRKNKSREAD